jgi:predicted permease
MSGRPSGPGSPVPDPPRLSRWWLHRITPASDRQSVAYDLEDEYRAMVDEGRSVREARAWYRRQVWRSTFPLLRTRWARGAGSLGGSWALDLRLAMRMGWKNPGLTVVAVFALAIGIPLGLLPNHAASLFMQPPTVPEGDRLHIVKSFDRRASGWAGASWSDYLVWRDRLETFERVAAVRRTGFNLRLGSSTDASMRSGPSVEGAEATAEALSLLRTPPILGRLPTAEDGRVGAPKVALLSRNLWQDRLASDSSVVGSVVELSGVPHTVVGIMPDDFHFPYRAQVWVVAQRSSTEEGTDSWMVFGRLADGVTREESETEAVGVGAAIDPEDPERAEWLRPAVVPFTPGLFGVGRDGLAGEQGFVLIQALALFVLFVACINIGMLMLVRTVSRSRELAVRNALGAGRGRIVLQLFLEAFVLAVVAAGVGLALAEFASGRLEFMERLLPHWLDLGVQPATVAQALALAVFSAAVVGVIPALKVTGRNVHQTIQRASAARTGVRFGGISSLLIVTDVALAVVAVGIALGMSDDVRSVAGMEPTIAADEYLTAIFGVPVGATAATSSPGGEDVAVRRARTEDEFVARLQAEPAVRGVALASTLPGMDGRNERFEILGREVADYEDARQASVARVRPGFFEALDQPIVSGRALSALDATPEAAGVVVNTQFVTEFFQGRNAVGQRIRAVERGAEGSGEWVEIVGTVGEVRRSATERRQGPMVYRAAQPGALGRTAVAIRLGDDPEAFTPRLRDIAHEVDPAALVDEPMSLDRVESFDDSVLGWFELGMRVMIAILIGMAASGTYALLSFTVRERAQELAVRAALGSPRAAVVATIGRRALLQIGGGVLVGMAITGVFFHLSTQGGWVPVVPPALMTLGSGLVVLLGVGVLAFVGPMRRGLRIEPAKALQG